MDRSRIERCHPGAALRTLAWLAWVLPAAAAAGVPSLTAVPTTPQVTSLAPTQATAGQQVDLTLHGHALRDGLVGSFRAGIQADPMSRASADGRGAHMRIRVAPNAAPGRYQLTLVVNGRRLPQPTYVTVQAAPVKLAPLPHVTIKRKQGAAGFAPAVSILAQVTPSSVRAGRRVELVLNGRSLMRGLRIDYGQGVHVESVQVLSDTRAVAVVSVDASAAPGRRMPRASEPDARVQVLPQAALQIAAGGPSLRAPQVSGGGFAPRKPVAMRAPRVLSITPNRLEAGKDYTVTAYGEHLDAGLELRFGNGVRVDEVKVLDNRRAQVSLHVDPKAHSGIRQAQARADSHATWKVQTASLLVQPPFRIAKLPKPKLPKPDWKAIIKGRILLQGPKWFSGKAAVAHKDPITGKPMGQEVVHVGVHVPGLKDTTIFSWREQNPGLAEWFEVRFYAGGKLVAKRRIEKRHVAWFNKNMLPTWLIPDPTLIATLAQAVPAGDVTLVRNKKTGKWAVSGQVKASTAFGPKDGLPASDLTWEVVGYRNYYQSGVERKAALRARAPVMVAALGGFVPRAASPGRQVAREVERSERWPLNVPARPTGLACGSQAPSSLDVKLIDNGATGKDKQFSTDQATSAHTGERWQLVGALDLKRSPWSSSPQVFQPAVGRGKNKKVLFTTWRFDNVYVDWGDGTVRPLAVSQKGNPGPGKYHADTVVDIDHAMQKHLHAYSQTGSYTVRVYQLAEGDIQDESAANVSLAANHGAGLYGAAVALGGGGGHSHNDQAAPSHFHHAKATGNHAYMLMCKQVVIRPRHDDASDGPLNLVAAKVRGFPEQPGDDSPPKGVKVAPPAGDSSPLPGLAQGAGAAPANSHERAMALSGAHPSLNSQDMSRIFHAGPGGVPKFSACDVSLTGGGYLYYYGQGRARVTWYLDGHAIGSRMVSPGPSTPRSDPVLASKDPGPPLVSAWGLITSPSIPLKQVGKHRLSFDAQVMYDASGLTGLSGLMGRALGSGGRHPDHRLAAQLAAGLHGAPALGVLPPQGVSIPHGGDPVAWLNRPLQQVARAAPKRLLVAASGGVRFDTGNPIALGTALSGAGGLPKRKPPTYVAAPARDYQVAGTQSGQPCTFRFPVQGGAFIVGGLQNPGGGKPNVTHQGNRWSGSGKLFIHLAGSGGLVQWPVPIKFKDWTLKNDQTTVASGSFDLSDPIQSSLPMPGVQARVQRLQGKAGDSVRMTLRAHISNANIRATDNQAAPPALVATAVLSPQGDWYADGLSLPTLDVYDSGFTLAPKSVVLDFSATQGSGCGAGGDGWMGLAFGAGSRLSAYTFQLKHGQAAPVSGWGIDDQGLCGQHKFGVYDSPVEQGTIHWDGIDATAAGGRFTARYRGLRVHVPWLDVDLKGGDRLMHAGKGSGGGRIELNLTGDAPARQFGPVKLDANGLQLGTLKGVGMAVRAHSTGFAFTADGRAFADQVNVPDLYFGMDGKAYFDGSGGSAHVSLSGRKGRLSQGVVDLQGLDVVATPGESSRLLFNFSTELRISDALPAAQAPVSYRIDEAVPGTYTGSGPVTGHFVIHKPFPDANPSTDSVIHPDYVGPQDGHTASAGPLHWLIRDARADSGSHMRYCGDVDLGLFGGPPVKGGFALGYQGSDDFWAARADVSLGTSGTPLVPPYMTLYTIGGGLGYNVAIDSFATGSSCDVHAKIDHTPAFNAHLLVGDPSHFVYGFDGELTVKVSGPEAGARMDYKAWLVRHQWNGGGDFYGRFQYASGNFDGTLNGHYGFLDDKVYIEATHDAIAMHFGGGKWYIHAGTKDNPVRGHVLIVNAGAWLGLGSEGMRAGAKAHLHVGGGNCSSACAEANANTLLEAEITPQPHIRADAHMHVDAHACAFDVCLGAGVGSHMHLAALPPELALGFNLGGCPPGHLDVGLEVLPNPKPHIGGGVCLW